VCAANGACAQWYLSGVSTCAAAGYGPDPDCDVCGNGTAGPGELCDGTSFADRDGDGTPDSTCAAFGYGGGTLGCNVNCAPDFSGCTP
jgi:hypothetical protein